MDIVVKDVDFLHLHSIARVFTGLFPLRHWSSLTENHLIEAAAFVCSCFVRARTCRVNIPDDPMDSFELGMESHPKLAWTSPCSAQGHVLHCFWRLALGRYAGTPLLFPELQLQAMYFGCINNAKRYHRTWMTTHFACL